SVLASGSFDKTVCLWDARTWKLKGVLAKHEGAIRTLAFSPDGSRLATAGEDKTARLWDVATGKDLGVLARHNVAVKAVAFSRDGTRIATGSSQDGSPQGGQTKLWDARTLQELNTSAEWSNRASLT